MTDKAIISSAGRPKGRKNNSTLAREAASAAASLALRTRLGNGAQTMDAVQIMMAIAREALAAGDMHGALAAASLAAPYLHERKGIAAPMDDGISAADDIANDTDPDTMPDRVWPVD